MLSTIYNLIKSCAVWIISADHRREGLLAIGKGLNIMKVVSAMTPTKKDDQLAAFLLKKLIDASTINGMIDKVRLETAAKVITDIKAGNLRNVGIGLKDGRISLAIPGGRAEYRPEDGSVRFGLSI